MKYNLESARKRALNVCTTKNIWQKTWEVFSEKVTKFFHIISERSMFIKNELNFIHWKRFIRIRVFVILLVIRCDITIIWIVIFSKKSTEAQQWHVKSENLLNFSVAILVEWSGSRRASIVNIMLNLMWKEQWVSAYYCGLQLKDKDFTSIVHCSITLLFESLHSCNGHPMGNTRQDKIKKTSFFRQFSIQYYFETYNLARKTIPFSLTRRFFSYTILIVYFMDLFLSGQDVKYNVDNETSELHRKLYKIMLITLLATLDETVFLDMKVS